jgi:hypothetical protein
MKQRQRSHNPFAALHTLSAPPPVEMHAAVNARPSAPGGQYLPSSQVQVRSALETYHPSVMLAITLLWGKPEMNHYFERMFAEGGAPGGVHPEAMAELMVLAEIHWRRLPNRPRPSPYVSSAALGDIARAGHQGDPWSTAQWGARAAFRR